MSLCSNQYHIYLGSKDMNIYLIDVDRGKLLVVFQGHWNRVTKIFKAITPSILFTASQASCKVWHLDKDDCLRTFSSHLSSIINFYQATSQSQVSSIGSNGQSFIWNYENGSILGKGRFKIRGLAQTGPRSKSIFSAKQSQMSVSDRQLIDPSCISLPSGRNVQLNDSMTPASMELDQLLDDDQINNDEIVNIEFLDFFNDNLIVLCTNKNFISIYPFSKSAMNQAYLMREQAILNSKGNSKNQSTAISNTHNSYYNNTTVPPQGYSVLSEYVGSRSNLNQRGLNKEKNLSDRGEFSDRLHVSKEATGGSGGSGKNKGKSEGLNASVKKPPGFCNFDALCTIRSYRDQHIVSLKAFTTRKHRRLVFLVTTKTSCILYQFHQQKKQVRRLCAYLLNSRQQKQEIFQHVRQRNTFAESASRNSKVGLFSLRQEISTASLHQGSQCPTPQMQSHSRLPHAQIQDLDKIPAFKNFQYQQEDKKQSSIRKDERSSRIGKRAGIDFFQDNYTKTQNQITDDAGMPANVVITNLQGGGTQTVHGQFFQNSRQNTSISNLRNPYTSQDRENRMMRIQQQPLGIKMQYSLPYSYYFTSCESSLLYGSMGRAFNAKQMQFNSADFNNKAKGEDGSQSNRNEESLKINSPEIDQSDRKKIQGQMEFQREKEYLYVIIGDSRGYVHITNIFGIDNDGNKSTKEEKIYMQSARG